MGVYATELLRGFKGQHTNPAKHECRQLLKTIGRRQLLKRMKAERRSVAYVEHLRELARLGREAEREIERDMLKESAQWLRP